MRLHQLNLQYDPTQDRLLVRISTTAQIELRLWFTRRLTVGVMPLLRKLVAQQTDKIAALKAPGEAVDRPANPKIREFLSEIERETALKNSDFATPYKEPASKPGGDPRGVAQAMNDTLLVTEIALTPLDNAHLRIKFTGNSSHSAPSGKGQDVQIELDDKLMHGFLHLLEKAYANSQWAQNPTPPLDAEELKDAAATTRPQYLN